MNKILLIRFSSFGDVTQSLSVPSKLALLGGEVHWVTRADFAGLIEGHPQVKKIWLLERKKGFSAVVTLWKLIRQLQTQRFTHIYDAHNNLRSHILSLFLCPPLAFTRIFSPPLLLRKSQKRWKRFLLFRLRINRYRMPFSGQRDLLEPLKKWGIDETLPPPPQIQVSKQAQNSMAQKLAALRDFVVLAPSAAHALKRWPLEHWKTLIAFFPQEKFIVVGGTEDTFLQALESQFPEQVQNWAGKTSLSETTALISAAKILITNDTGVLHVAEQLGKKAVALMGPAPFGFPSRASTKIMELNLACRPCSKHGQGPCVNEKFHRCLVDITPEQVRVAVIEKLQAGPL